MNVSLKFRVFSHLNNKYIENEFIKYFIISQDGELYLHSKDDILLSINQPQYSIEFYTGLEDINGNNLYVGDIVSEKLSNFDVVTHIIEYDRKEARFVAVNKEKDIYCGINKDWISKKEITGNIHNIKKTLDINRK